MDKVIIVGDRQTIIDIAIQEYGGPDAAFKVVDDNADLLTSITNGLDAGMRLRIKSAPVDKDVVEYYVRNSIKPANDITTSDPEEPGEPMGDFNNDYNNDYF